MTEGSHAEVELKYPGSYELFSLVMTRLADSGLAFSNMEILCDTYISVERSEFDRWDYERVRMSMNGCAAWRFIHTRKRWKQTPQGLVRVEHEVDLDPDAASAMLRSSPLPLRVLSKVRRNYTGRIGDRDVTVSYDFVSWGNPCTEKMQVLEVETLTSEEDAAAAREELADWVRENLIDIEPEEIYALEYLMKEEVTSGSC